MATGGEGSGGVSSLPRGKSYPLNSGRLTGTTVARIAKALGLPRSASLEETRQMIEGKLSEEREPRNVLVEMTEAAAGTIISLRDESGVFLRVEPESEEEESVADESVAEGARERRREGSREERQAPRPDVDVDERDEGGGAGDYGLHPRTELERAVEELTERNTSLIGEIEVLRGMNIELDEVIGGLRETNTSLAEEVEKLKTGLGEEKERHRAEWRRNCQQLMEYDDLLLEKDQQIEELSRQLEFFKGGRDGGAATPTRGDALPTATPIRADTRPSAGSVGGSTPMTGDTPPTATPTRGVTLPTARSIVDPTPITGVPMSVERSLTESEKEVRGPTARRGVAVTDVSTSLVRGSSTSTPTRRGKAPPIEPFNGESSDVIFEDWLPALERAADWNGWSGEEKLLQLAGHLRGRALQEWNLLQDPERKTFDITVKSLKTRLGPGNRMTAAQDFRHTVQREGEQVADYIRRLEQMFRLAYGKDGMGAETREMLLFTQLQDGLRYGLMKSPAVSGAQEYRQLCTAARNEEKRLVELEKRQQYRRVVSDRSGRTSEPQGKMSSSEGGNSKQQTPVSQIGGDSRRCYKCNEIGHIARNCTKQKDSQNSKTVTQQGRSEKLGATKQVNVTAADRESTEWSPLLLECLYSSDQEDGAGVVKQVRINYKGSHQQYAPVQLQGVPARGAIDSGADITIVGGELFRRVAAVAKLKKCHLKKVDKVPHTYDKKTFQLDGRVDLDVTFGGFTMTTPVYIKIDAPEQLLLAEGVCRQLGIINYHPDVLAEGSKRTVGVKNALVVVKESPNTTKGCEETSDAVRGTPAAGASSLHDPGAPGSHGERNLREVSTHCDEHPNELTVKPTIETGASPARRDVVAVISRSGEVDGLTNAPTMAPLEMKTDELPDKLGPTAASGSEEEATVPTVRVWLSRSVRLLPGMSTTVPVRLEGINGMDASLLMEGDSELESRAGIEVMNTLLDPNSATTQLTLVNHSGFTQKLQEGCTLGEAAGVEVVQPSSSTMPGDDKEAENDLTKSLTIRNGQVLQVSSESREECRRKKLLELLEEPELPPEERQALLEFLADNHNIFSLEGERGETNLVEMVIDTGDARPQKQPPRRMPFSVRQEVARQLREMQQGGVIEPSNSPWASPVVLVRKRDGSHRFCVDYRRLNAVTKTDTFPLPRIDELLDQLGRSKYFSTIDLAAGFWQIRMHPDSKEKTAFVTPQGLFHFNVMPFGLTNAPAVFQRLMQSVVMCLNPDDGPQFASVYLDDILVFSETLTDHITHLYKVIQRIKDVGLKLKPSKCNFARAELEYLGHVITRDGIKTNPRLITAVKEFPRPSNVHDVRRFIGMASFYRRFIPNFASIASPLHQLTRNGALFEWNQEHTESFETLKQRLTSAPVLAYPRYDRDFTLETDASIIGLGAVLSQVQEDGRLHPVSYASRALSAPEKNYSITELETLAVVWALSHFHHHLYGNVVTIITDHTAVKAVLETPSPTGKHARWWTKVYGRGVKEVQLVYRAGRENVAADALSRSPHDPAPREELDNGEVQVSQLQSKDTDSYGISNLLELPREEQSTTSTVYLDEQKKDPDLLEVINFLQTRVLPTDDHKARKIALQAPLFSIVDGTLYFVDSKHRNKRVVVPKHLRKQILVQNHSGRYGGHFSGRKIYKSLSLHWWWEGMLRDVMDYCRSCPDCAVATGTGRIIRPPLCPIPICRPFQIWGVDIMDLPKTARGNQHAIVFQDLFTKWPMVFPAPDQKAVRIARLLVEEVVPLFGVPESLLSDRGANLLSHLMLDVCKLLGTKKLNTTAYHPQCDGTVERFNRTLKGMLRKHAARFGTQWDTFLPGVLWSYRNTPHCSTGEKPSYLMFGVDCRSPTEASFLPVPSQIPVDIEDYREELILSLSSARELAYQTIRKAQQRYKNSYDRTSSQPTFKVGDWVLVRFPQEESGRNRKLSRPFHGPYRIVARNDPDVTVVKVYFPSERTLRVHQTRICRCPAEFPAGYYWYGGRRRGPGRPPKWVDRLLAASSTRPGPEGEGDVEEVAVPDHDSDVQEMPVTDTDPGNAGSAVHGSEGTDPKFDADDDSPTLSDSGYDKSNEEMQHCSGNDVLYEGKQQQFDNTNSVDADDDAPEDQLLPTQSPVTPGITRCSTRRRRAPDYLARGRACSGPVG